MAAAVLDLLAQGRALFAHLGDEQIAELAGRDFGGAVHLAGEVVGHNLLVKGLFVSLGDHIRRFLPADMFEHHHAAEQQ